MAKFIIRVPTEQYAYIQAEYDSIKEYTDLHPEFAEAVRDVRKKIKQLSMTPEQKFEEDLN